MVGAEVQMAQLLAWLGDTDALLCADGTVAAVFMDFDADVEGVARNSFVSCAGLYGTSDLAPRAVVVLGTADRARFVRALPALQQTAPQEAAKLEAALLALPPTTEKKTIKLPRS